MCCRLIRAFLVWTFDVRFAAQTHLVSRVARLGLGQIGCSLCRTGIDQVNLSVLLFFLLDLVEFLEGGLAVERSQLWQFADDSQSSLRF